MKPRIELALLILAIAFTTACRHSVAAAPPPSPPPASAAAPPITAPEPEPPPAPPKSNVPVVRPTAKPKELAPAPAPVPQSKTTVKATLPPAEAAEYRKRAEKAIAEAEQNIDAVKEIHLKGQIQSTLRQARSFLRKAQKALEDDDVVQAATLAEKSRLLSEDVRKRSES